MFQKKRTLRSLNQPLVFDLDTRTATPDFEKKGAILGIVLLLLQGHHGHRLEDELS